MRKVVPEQSISKLVCNRAKIKYILWFWQVKKVLFAIAVGVLPLVSTHPAISQSLDQQFRNEQSIRNDVKSLCPTRYQNAQYKIKGMDGNRYWVNVRFFLTKENELLRLEYDNDCVTRTGRDFIFDGFPCWGKPVIVGRQTAGKGVDCLLKKEGSELVLYRKLPSSKVLRSVEFVSRKIPTRNEDVNNYLKNLR